MCDCEKMAEGGGVSEVAVGPGHKRKERPDSSGCEDSFIQERREQITFERDISSLHEILSVIQDDIKRSNKNTENQIRLSQEQTVLECTENFKAELATVSSSIQDLRIENEQLRATVDRLQKESENQKNEIADLKGAFRFERLNAVEKDQYTRRNDVKIYGLVEEGGTHGENSDQTSQVVRKLFRDKLNVTVSETDIDIAHRLGNFEKDRERSVIVRFTRRSVRNEVIQNRKKLKDTPVIITDNLSPANMRLFYRLKELVGGRNVWSIEGKLFAKVGHGQTKRVDMGNIDEIESEERDFIARYGRRESALRGDRDRGRSARGQGRGGRARGRHSSRGARGQWSERGAERGDWRDNGGQRETRGRGREKDRGEQRDRESHWRWTGRERGRGERRDISPFYEEEYARRGERGETRRGERGEGGTERDSTPTSTEGRLRDGQRGESPMLEEGELDEGAGAGTGGRNGGQYDDAKKIPVIGEGTRLRGYGRGRGKTP